LNKKAKDYKLLYNINLSYKMIVFILIYM